MKLVFNAGSYKVLIPKALVENSLHWVEGQELEVSCDGRTLKITKKKEQPMYIIAIDTLRTITKGYRYFATKTVGGKVRIMDDVGTIRWMNKEHFRGE